MKRTFVALLWLIILTSTLDDVDQNFTEDYQNNPITDEYGAAGNVVALSSDSDCKDHDDDGVCDEGGMVGLELDCCTDEEMFVFVATIVIFIGIPSYLIVRKIWKFVKRRIYRKTSEGGEDEEVVEERGSLGSHLPVTQEELINWKRRNEGASQGKGQKDPIKLKEEILLLSMFLFVVYLFWNNGI
ncbi:MAG: hypothetical protein DWC02_03920 [Candidatus Poseidoniales archaeon]|nr:MAG: hypothetical protein DWC02_03920 [Candidatus Poseidoniales archaeon]